MPPDRQSLLILLAAISSAVGATGGYIRNTNFAFQSTGGSTNEADEEQPAQISLSAETYRNTQQNEFTDPYVGLAAAAADPASRTFQKPQLRNKRYGDSVQNEFRDSAGCHTGLCSKKYNATMYGDKINPQYPRSFKDACKL